MTSYISGLFWKTLSFSGAFFEILISWPIKSTKWYISKRSKVPGLGNALGSRFYCWLCWEGNARNDNGLNYLYTIVSFPSPVKSFMILEFALSICTLMAGPMTHIK